MSKTIWGLCCILALTLVQTSCGIFRKAPRAEAVDSTGAVANPMTHSDSAKLVADAEKQALLQAMLPHWKRELVFETFSGKAKMQYQGRGQKFDITAHFRIKKDETIWASVTALGGIVPVARILITRDSFHLINYQEKVYTKLALSEAIEMLPVPADFGTLQSLIVGTSLRSGGIAKEAYQNEAGIVLQVQEPGIEQSVLFNPADSTISTLHIRSAVDGGPAGTINFGKYERLEGQLFPSVRAIAVSNSGEQHFLEMNFNNVDLNKELDFPFNVPKNYQMR